MPLYPPGVGANGNLKQVLYAKLEADATTTSAAFTDLLTLSITTVANSNLLIWISFSASFSASLSKSAMFNLSIDGTEKLRTGMEEFTAMDSSAIVYRATEMTAAAHTIALRWRINTAGDGTLRCRPVTVSDGETATIRVMNISV
jgi:hypothetical protein